MCVEEVLQALVLAGEPHLEPPGQAQFAFWPEMGSPLPLLSSGQQFEQYRAGRGGDIPDILKGLWPL